MGDHQVEGPAASSTTMDAAEQLVQLSGGGESESKSAGSVVKAAGEEHRDIAGGVPAVVGSSTAGKRCEKVGAEDDEAVMGGVRRRKPRFRSLAEIYRRTKRMDRVPCREEADEEDEKQSKGNRKKRWATDDEGKKRKTTARRATDSAAHEAIPAAAKKVVRRGTSTVRES